MSKFTKKCMAIPTLCRTAPGWHISLLILTFSNGCVSVKTSLINTKLGNFVNLGVLFLTMWINRVTNPMIYRLAPSPSRFEIRQWRILHGGEKIWILCSSGKNNINNINFYIYRQTDDGVFDDFPKIFQNCFERQTNVPEHFPKNSDDCRWLSRKTWRRFDHTPTNLRRLERVFRCCSVCETMEDYKERYLMVWTNYMSPCSSIVGLYFKGTCDVISVTMATRKVHKSVL